MFLSKKSGFPLVNCYSDEPENNLEMAGGGQNIKHNPFQRRSSVLAIFAKSR